MLFVGHLVNVVCVTPWETPVQGARPRLATEAGVSTVGFSLLFLFLSPHQLSFTSSIDLTPFSIEEGQGKEVRKGDRTSFRLSWLLDCSQRRGVLNSVCGRGEMGIVREWSRNRG